MKLSYLLLLARPMLLPAAAQTPDAHQQFEVASVKQAEVFTEGQPASGSIQIDGAQVHLIRFALKSVITIAYKVKAYQVIGPDWLESQRFNIDAKMPVGSSRDQVPEMLQSLLADRFHLKFHKETKEFPVYAISVVAGGTKLLDVSDPGDSSDAKEALEATGFGSREGLGANYGKGSSYSLANNKLEGKKLTVAQLSGILSSCLDRPVVDMTELKGKYNINVALSEEDYRGMMIRSATNAGVAIEPRILRYLDRVDNASLFAGLKDLGLKLEPRKAPLAVVVIDSILKSPTEN